jgi:putative membrane protein
MIVTFMAIHMLLIGLAGSSFAASGWMWVLPVVMVAMMALMFFVGPGRMMHGMQHPGSEGSPSEILARRFARGQITKEQYDEISKALQGSQRPSKSTPSPPSGAMASAGA